MEVIYLAADLMAALLSIFELRSPEFNAVWGGNSDGKMQVQSKRKYGARRSGS